jgi:hypothetical protein
MPFSRVHTVASPIYASIHHEGLTSLAPDLMAHRPVWHLPLCYMAGDHGAKRVASSAYLGNRDTFLFVVDRSRGLDDPTDQAHAGLFRGFILRLSATRNFNQPRVHNGSARVVAGYAEARVIHADNAPIQSESDELTPRTGRFLPTSDSR